jgi:hypothetical protein
MDRLATRSRPGTTLSELVRSDELPGRLAVLTLQPVPPRRPKARTVIPADDSSATSTLQRILAADH